MKHTKLFLLSVVITALFVTGCNMAGGASNIVVAGEDPYLAEEKMQRTIYNSIMNDGDTDGDGTPDSMDKDIDGDGLTNDFEMLLGTNPYMADTDGDGFNDKEEVYNNFNPLIADLPDIKLTLTSTPSIGLITKETSGTTQTNSTSITEGTSRTATTNSTNSHTSSFTFGFTETLTFGVKDGISIWKIPNFSFAFAARQDKTTSDTTSFSQSESNTMNKNFNEAVSKASSSSYSIEGGVLSYRVKLSNSSRIAYTVKIPSLSASYTTWHKWTDKEFKIPIGNLTMVNGAAITLAPGESREMIFSTNMNLGLTRDVIKYANSIIVELSSYEMSYNGKDITERLTQANARCAQLTIDYGPNVSAIENSHINVAVKTRVSDEITDYSNVFAASSLRNLLENAGYKTYGCGLGIVEIDEAGRIVSVNGITNGDSNYKAQWWLYHVRRDYLTNKTQSQVYSPFAINADEIIVRSTDEIALMYTADFDDDNLPNRLEQQFGTDPNKKDTDGDGWDDYREVIKEGTNPLSPDTDGDAAVLSSTPASETKITINNVEYCKDFIDSADPAPLVSRYEGSPDIKGFRIFNADGKEYHPVKKNEKDTTLDKSFDLVFEKIDAHKVEVQVDRVSSTKTYSIENTRTGEKYQNLNNSVFIGLEPGDNKLEITIRGTITEMQGGSLISREGDVKYYLYLNSCILERPVVKSFDKVVLPGGVSARSYNLKLEALKDTRIQRIIIWAKRQEQTEDAIKQFAVTPYDPYPNSFEKDDVLIINKSGEASSPIGVLASGYNLLFKNYSQKYYVYIITTDNDKNYSYYCTNCYTTYPRKLSIQIYYNYIRNKFVHPKEAGKENEMKFNIFACINGHTTIFRKDFEEDSIGKNYKSHGMTKDDYWDAKEDKVSFDEPKKTLMDSKLICTWDDVLIEFLSNQKDPFLYVHCVEDDNIDSDECGYFEYRFVGKSQEGISIKRNCNKCYDTSRNLTKGVLRGDMSIPMGENWFFEKLDSEDAQLDHLWCLKITSTEDITE